MKAKHKPAGAGGTRNWLRKKAAAEARLGRMVDDPELAAPRRSKRLMKCMPELLAADLTTGQVTRSSGATPSRSRATGDMFDADGVDSAASPAEVGDSVPHANKFDQPASDESNGESD